MFGSKTLNPNNRGELDSVAKPLYGQKLYRGFESPSLRQQLPRSMIHMTGSRPADLLFLASQVITG